MQTLPVSNRQAFGERLGIDVPTRYPLETHDFLSAVLASDAIVTPMLLGFGARTRWLCRIVGGLLLAGRVMHHGNNPDLMTQLQFEAISGVALISAAFLARLNLFERGYLLISGILVLGNALMTQIDA